MALAQLLNVNGPVDLADTTVENRWDAADAEGGTLSTSAAEITGTRISTHPGGDLLLFGTIDFRCAKAPGGDIYEGGISLNGTTVATLHQSTRSLTDDPDSAAHNSGQAQGMALVTGVAPNLPIYLTARNSVAARGRWGVDTSLQIMQLGDGAQPLMDVLANAEIPAAALDRMPLDDSGRQPLQAAGAQLTLTGSLQRPSGCYYDTPRAGSWLAIGTFDFTVHATNDSQAVGGIGVDGALVLPSFLAVSRSYLASANTSNYAGSRTSPMAFALTGPLDAGQTIELLANRSQTTGSGSAPTVESGHTKLAVIQIA